MTTNSAISLIGVFVSLTGLLLSVIVGILYQRKASSPQWPNLTRWEKYVYPLIVLIGPVLLTGIGCAIGGIYGNSGQVTYERWIIGLKLGVALSVFFWMALAVSYFVGIEGERAKARGWLPSWLPGSQIKK